MSIRGLFRFFGRVEFQATTVAGPELSELSEVVNALPQEERGRFYAGFLEGPSWAEGGERNERKDTGESSADCP